MGACIPVNLVTVWATEKKPTRKSLPDREGAGCEKLTSGEKGPFCGDTYQAVDIYPVTDQEHRQRGKKRKEERQRARKAGTKAASLRRRLRKVLANFDQNGFNLTATYEDAYLPEDEEGCWRDVKNYARRVRRAVRKRFGVRGTWLKLMLWAVRNGEAGRLHMHSFAQCPGLSEAERRELRYMLEDLWRRRVPGTREFEPMGNHERRPDHHEEDPGH